MRVMKKCTKCKDNQEDRFFRVLKTGKLSSWCLCCERTYTNARYIKRREQQLAYKKKHYNPKAKKEYNTKYSEEHRDELVKNSKNYYYKNKEKLLVQKRQYNINNKIEILKKKAIYQKKNKALINAYMSKRRFCKINATPKWLTSEHENQILSLYKTASKLTKETGVKYEVDHIIPIKGKTVTGLHVPWNLQVITKIENIKKGNRI